VKAARARKTLGAKAARSKLNNLQYHRLQIMTSRCEVVVYMSLKLAPLSNLLLCIDS
jgi:hypothetical protein